MKVVIEVELGNAAMQTELDLANCLNEFISRLLKHVDDRTIFSGFGRNLYDINGNTVGKVYTRGK